MNRTSDGVPLAAVSGPPDYTSAHGSAPARYSDAGMYGAYTQTLKTLARVMDITKQYVAANRLYYSRWHWAYLWRPRELRTYLRYRAAR